jgi:hypothetical protein
MDPTMNNYYDCNFAPLAERLAVLCGALRSGGIPSSLGPRIKRMAGALARSDCTKAARHLADLEQALDDLRRPALEVFAKAGYRLLDSPESLRWYRNHSFEGEAGRTFIIPSLSKLLTTAENLCQIFELKA